MKTLACATPDPPGERDTLKWCCSKPGVWREQEPARTEDGLNYFHLDLGSQGKVYYAECCTESPLSFPDGGPATMRRCSIHYTDESLALSQAVRLPEPGMVAALLGVLLVALLRKRAG